jgi:GxxExxY protein
MEFNDLTGRIIGAAIEVHKQLGPGLLESVYEECLCYELKQRNINFERQKSLPIRYKDVKLDCGYRLDVVVEGAIILELKSCEKVEDIHRAQLLTYLKLSGLKVGLILNFNVAMMKDGLIRIVNEFEEGLS